MTTGNLRKFGLWRTSQCTCFCVTVWFSSDSVHDNNNIPVATYGRGDVANDTGGRRTFAPKYATARVLNRLAPPRKVWQDVQQQCACLWPFAQRLYGTFLVSFQRGSCNEMWTGLDDICNLNKNFLFGMKYHPTFQPSFQPNFKPSFNLDFQLNLPLISAEFAAQLFAQVPAQFLAQFPVQFPVLLVW